MVRTVLSLSPRWSAVKPSTAIWTPAQRSGWSRLRDEPGRRAASNSPGAGLKAHGRYAVELRSSLDPGATRRGTAQNRHRRTLWRDPAAYCGNPDSRAVQWWSKN